VRNAFTDEWDGREAEIVARLAELRPRLEAAEDAGDTEVIAVWAGQGAGLVRSVEPAGEIVRRIVEEAERLLCERQASGAYGGVAD
jgi:nitronate monooxygenase